MKIFKKNHPLQTRLEEIFNTLAHGVGIFLSIAALVILIIASALAASPVKIIASIIYGLSLVTLYTTSTLYHGVQNPKLKKTLIKLDHAGIYFLIAGSYTPFCLITLHGPIGWSLLAIIWLCAFSGMIIKFVFKDYNRYRHLSLAMYLVMGWLALFVIEPLWQSLTLHGFILLIAGGLCYTIGSIFFALDHKYHFGHFMWHLFVLAGSICHFFAILFFVILS